MKQKKIPLRMCVGCQEMKPKKELTRIVKNNEGLISVDYTGKKPGRGAYICRSVQCLEKARKTKKLERTFEMAIDKEIYDTLENELEEMNSDE
jgi:uncharacterized protein